MDTKLLERAARDRSLSPKALGLLTRCLAIGRVLSVEDLTEGRKEGREAVRTGMAELRERGYVVISRMQDPVTGRWVTMQAFTSPKSGFPEAGDPDSLYSQQAIEHVVSIPTPSGVGIETRTAEVNIRYAEIFGSNEIPEPPKETKVQKSSREVRMAKTADQWSSSDITEEFAYRVRDKYPDKALGQVGGPALNKIIGSWLKDRRITSAELAAALDLFFADPRLLHDIGQGVPAWKRFVHYVPTVRSQARIKSGLERPVGDVTEQEAEESAQRALRRLSE
jgi:hypothetical protein